MKRWLSVMAKQPVRYDDQLELIDYISWEDEHSATPNDNPDGYSPEEYRPMVERALAKLDAWFDGVVEGKWSIYDEEWGKTMPFRPVTQDVGIENWRKWMSMALKTGDFFGDGNGWLDDGAATFYLNRDKEGNLAPVDQEKWAERGR